MLQKLPTLPTIKDYAQAIANLPVKKKYTKEELLIPTLCVAEEGPIALYYVPHNETINTKAKVFIVGITPGFSQMNTSLMVARQCMEENKSLEMIPYECKKAARLSGVLRKNTCDMLDELGLKAYLGISSCHQLFSEADELLHTTALIPFATFVKGQNYTGHQPNMLKSELLMRYIKASFKPQLRELKDALVIPLGKGVEAVLEEFIKKGELEERQCLFGFPHPSGANVNRKKQFEAEKEHMQQIIKDFFEA